MMHGLASFERSRWNDDHLASEISKPLNLYRTIFQTERDQTADAARICDAIRKAEGEIAKLERLPFPAQQLHTAVIAVCDRVIGTIRDVQRNMEGRVLASERMLWCLNDEFLRQRSRFATDDLEDRTLRAQLFELLECTPTSALADRLLDANASGNAACAELVRFEFQCRDDRDEFMGRFEAVAAKVASNDPVEMRKRIASIRKAIERVNAGLRRLRERVRAACPSQEDISAPG